MALNFPPSPVLNETYTAGNKTWKWSGYAWNLDSSSSTDLTLVYDTANAAYDQANTANNQAVFDQVSVVSSNTTITINDSNKVYICDTLNDSKFILPKASDVTQGFNVEIHVLSGDDKKTTVEVGNTITDTISYGGFQYKNLRFDFADDFSDDTLESLQSKTFLDFFAPVRFALQDIRGQDNLDNTYNFKFIRISNTSFTMSR